jgi:hypothetical protein
METGLSSGWVAMKLILVDKLSNTIFQLDAEIWKIIRPTYLAIRSLTASEELTSDICVLSYSVLIAAICECDMDLTLIFADKKELAEDRLRSEGSEACWGDGDGTDLAATFMLILSSKSRKEVSLDLIETMSGTSELAVWRINNTMTLKIYLIQESSRGGGSPHEYIVELPAPGLGEVDRSSTVSAKESDEDECRVQRDPIVRQSNFKIKSCD